MSLIGKSYKKTVELRKGSSSDVNDDTLITLTDPDSTEDFTLDIIDFAPTLRRKITSKSATYTILLTDDVIDFTANTFTATLPTAVGIKGKYFDIKNSGAGIVTLEGDGSETIDGSLNETLAAGDAISVLSDGANWIIL